MSEDQEHRFSCFGLSFHAALCGAVYVMPLPPHCVATNPLPAAWEAIPYSYHWARAGV